MARGHSAAWMGNVSYMMDFSKCFCKDLDIPVNFMVRYSKWSPSFVLAARAPPVFFFFLPPFFFPTSSVRSIDFLWSASIASTTDDTFAIFSCESDGSLGAVTGAEVEQDPSCGSLIHIKTKEK